MTATLVWIGALAVAGSEGAAGPGGVALGAALGSSQALSPTAAVGTAQDHRPGPAAEDVTRAYTVLRRWIRDFEAPSPGDAAAQVPLTVEDEFMGGNNMQLRHVGSERSGKGH